MCKPMIAAMLPRLSTDLDDDSAQPYFVWDVPVTVRELRELLHHADEGTRALWTARVLREARYADVWRFLSLDEVVERFAMVRRHLGRRRAFWEFLIDGWRSDGLLPESA
jgi:hypothetical protein